jgi:Zn-finger nucleic acid-binding protein
MSWQKKLMQKLVRKHQNPCPNCGDWWGPKGELRILPFRDTPQYGCQPVPGKVFTKEFMALLKKRMANGAAWEDTIPKVQTDSGPHVIDCPRCKGKGWLDTKESIFLQQLADETADNIPKPYDPEYGDDRICMCGHPYYRHFDTYSTPMEPVGCKYCDCRRFKEKK